MKITCQSCQSKYTIADEKVLGKVVKIRCRKCGVTIFVNGNDGTSSIGSDPGQESLSSHGPEGGTAEGWTVNVAEGDQRAMSEAEVVAAFQNRIIDPETYVWKDGMSDWVPLRESGELFRACTASAAPNPAASQLAGEGSASSTAIHSDVAAAASTNGGAAFPIAARRPGGRGAGVDLFGGAAQAGADGDVVTSAPMRIPEPHDGPQKPTGARNESSVLFSLSALTSKPSSAPPPNSDNNEASGLIDIRALSAQLAVEDKKQSRVEDIMNLSGGGAFSPTLMAPTLSAPAWDAYAPDADSGAELSSSSGRNKGVILLAIGASACVVVAAIGGALYWMRGKEQPAASELAAASAPHVESTSPPPAAEVQTAAQTASAASAGASTPTVASAPIPTAEASAKPPDNKVATGSTPAKEPASTPQPRVAPAIVEAGPFNMGEARARLGAAAASAASCKKPNGPTGTGRVIVLFAPSGAPQSATVSGPPFEGTSTGACVAARFRAVRVPPFSGTPFSVSKSFTIN